MSCSLEILALGLFVLRGIGEKDRGGHWTTGANNDGRVLFGSSPGISRYLMSLWLPRPLLARSCRRPIYAHLVSRSLPHRALPRHSSTKASTVAVTQESTSNPKTPEPKSGPPAPKENAPLATRVWKKVKHEAQHYWHGTKLLVSEVRISARLQWKILQGDTLTRRERRQASIFLFPSSYSFANSDSSAETHHSRSPQACAFCCVHRRSVHGVAPSRRSEALP